MSILQIEETKMSENIEEEKRNSFGLGSDYELSHLAGTSRETDIQGKEIEMNKGRNAYITVTSVGDNYLNPEIWYADSGANQHMTNQEKWLRNFEKFNESIKIGIGSGTPIEATGKGDIILDAFDGTEWQEFELKNVLYVSTLKCNLFSISSVTSEDYTVIVKKEVCEVKKNGKTYIVGNNVDGLYHLKLKAKEETEEDSKKED